MHGYLASSSTVIAIVIIIIDTNMNTNTRINTNSNIDMSMGIDININMNIGIDINHDATTSLQVTATSPASDRHGGHLREVTAAGGPCVGKTLHACVREDPISAHLHIRRRPSYKDSPQGSP